MAGKSATANNKDDLIQLIKWRSVVTVIVSAIKQKPQIKFKDNNTATKCNFSVWGTMLKTADNARLSTKMYCLNKTKINKEQQT